MLRMIILTENKISKPKVEILTESVYGHFRLILLGKNMNLLLSVLSSVVRNSCHLYTTIADKEAGR